MKNLSIRNFNNITQLISLFVLSLFGIVSGGQCVNQAMDQALRTELNTSFPNAIVAALKTANSLNYYTDTCATLDLYGNKLTLDWGFSGSGDIFKPLESITHKLTFAEDKCGIISKSSLVKTIAFNFIKNELFNKQGGKVDGLKWLNDFKFTPIHLFGLKLILLVKSLETEQDMSHFIEEVTCLLFRLSLVDDLTLIDKNKQLTTYLPEFVNNMLQNVGNGVPEFIDQIWGEIVNNKPMSSDLVLKKSVKIEGFIFSDKALANKAFEFFKNYTGSDFYQDFTNFGEGKFEVVDSVQFKKANSEITETDILKNAQFNPFANKLANYKEIILDSNASTCSNLEAVMIKQVKRLSGKCGVILVEDSAVNNFWVARVTDNIGSIGIAKSFALTLTRVFKEYVAIKKSLYDGNSTVAFQYRACVKAREELHNDLEKFIRSTDGKAIFDSMCKQINSVVNCNVNEEICKNLTTMKATLEDLISSLDAMKITKEQQKIKLRILQVQIPSSLENEIADITKQIADKKSELVQVEMQLKKIGAGAELNQDEKDLEQLIKLVQEQETSGKTVDAEVLEIVDNLKQKIASAKKEKINTVTLQDKLSVREKVAQIFEQTAEVIYVKLQNEKLTLNATSSDLVKKTRELLAKNSKYLTEKFAKRLKEYANEIREGSRKAEQLNIVRTTGQMSPELNALEIEVGHILDGNNHENFVYNLMAKPSIFNEFVHDMVTDGNKDPKIMGLKQMIMESIKKVLDGSSTIQDNFIVIKYAMQYVPSSIKAILRISGAEQLVDA